MESGVTSQLKATVRLGRFHGEAKEPALHIVTVFIALTPDPSALYEPFWRLPTTGVSRRHGHKPRHFLRVSFKPMHTSQDSTAVKSYEGNKGGLKLS